MGKNGLGGIIYIHGYAQPKQTYGNEAGRKGLKAGVAKYKAYQKRSDNHRIPGEKFLEHKTNNGRDDDLNDESHFVEDLKVVVK